MFHVPFVTALPAAAVTAIGSLIRKNPTLIAYTAGATLYEGVRTFPRIRKAKWHAKSSRNGYKGPHVPLLTTEKIAASVFCSLQGIYAAPISLVEDVKRVEMKARGLDPLLYGYTPRQIEGSDVYSSYWDVVMNNEEVLEADR
jgi:hypothetical protein